MDMSVLFSLFSLTLAFLVSVLLFLSWIKHKKRRPRFLIFWAIGLLLMYAFQIPIILSNLGMEITVTDFNSFFTLAFPITFLSLILIYLGVVEVSKQRIKTRAKVVMSLWFLSSIIFFTYHFIVRGGIIETHSLTVVGNLVFYLPIRVLIIATLLRWFVKSTSKTLLLYLGTFGVILESLLGLFRNLLFLKNILVYPPEYWYLALSGLKVFFLTQILGIISIAIGFFFLYRVYHKENG